MQNLLGQTDRMAAVKKKSYPGKAQSSKQVSKILINTSARFECLEDDTLACDLCTGKFYTVTELIHHHLRSHQDGWLYWCNICHDLVGISPSQLNKHIKMHPVSVITVSDTLNNFKEEGTDKIKQMEQVKVDAADDLFEEENPCVKDTGKLSALHPAEEGNRQDEIFDAESIGPWAISLEDGIELSDHEDKCVDDSSTKILAIYCCNFCPEEFASLQELIDHTHLYHRPADSTHCEKNKNYKHHQKEAPNASVLKEKVMSKGFVSRKKTELDKHIGEHLKPKDAPIISKNVCPFCGKTFCFASSLRKHKKYHTNDLPFMCALCDVKHPSKHLLETHIRSVHNQERPHKCTDCPKAYDTALKLRRHMVSIHGSIFENQCGICDFAASSARALEQHLKRYGGKCLPICKFCGIKLKRNALARHEQTHLGKLFECTVCSQKFSRKCALNDHLNTHVGARPYQCEKCEMSFAHYHAWYGHNRTDCGKKEANPRMGRKTRSKVFNVTDDGFECIECDFRSKYKVTVYTHHKTKHTDYKTKPKPVFDCCFCGKVIKKKYNFENHINSHLGIRPYECKVCPKKFGSHLALYQHESTHCPGVRDPKESSFVKKGTTSPVEIKMADRMYVGVIE